MHPLEPQDKVVAPCPCRSRSLEDQSGQVVWRAEDTGEHCGNPSPGRWKNSYGFSGVEWCEDCITKICKWCRHD